MVGSAAKVPHCRADRTVLSADLWVGIPDCDVVLDANGVDTLSGSYGHLAPAGRLVVYGFATMFPRGGSGRPDWLKLAWAWLRTPRFSPLDLTTRNRSILAFNLSYLFDRTDLLREALAWFGPDLRLEPLATRSFPLREAGVAQRLLETGETTGKLVLVP